MKNFSMKFSRRSAQAGLTIHCINNSEATQILEFLRISGLNFFLSEKMGCQTRKCGKNYDNESSFVNHYHQELLIKSYYHCITIGFHIFHE